MDANQAAIALATAMNEARAASAGREAAAQDSRAAAVARLEALRRKLAPLYAAIPRDVEIFDLGLVAPEKPRLFIDIIAFVEPGRDGSGFRFQQETRTGRVTLLETEDEPALIEEITRYVARRLVARERALSLEGGERQPRLIGQPAPILPMTAEEAFRRWTRPEAKETTEAAQAVVPASDRQAPLAAEAAAAPAAAVEPDKAEAAPVETKAAEPRVVAKARPQAGGWWLWPLLALLIGIGLGALALYLYAATLVQ